MNKNLVLRCLFVLVVLGCIWGGFATYDRSSISAIRVVVNSAPQTEDYQGVMAMKRYIEQESSGEMRVGVYPYGEFCASARECIAFLRNGILDVFMTTGGGVVDIFPPAQIIDIPYLFSGDPVAECVFDGPFTDELRDAVLEHDPRLRLMAVGTTGGFRSFATVNKTVAEPQDLSGVKIRTTTAELHQVLIRGFGASPTPISWSELYVSLATGVVDGTTNSISDIVDGNLHEQLKRLTTDNHSYMGAMWWYSAADWQQMDAESQRIIAGGFEQLKHKMREVSRNSEALAIDKFVEAGGEITHLSPQQRASFEATAAPVRDWYAESFGQHWLDRIEAAVSQCQQADSESVINS